ncbi:CobW family GTP-binding protein [Vibrio lentus]|uniref:CobW family GTP-binding protein n=1 Tax=Vibrio lentus TaxID=136468 RepID=UPI000C84207E|nr:GTP-binding protein [Vibrio lentus]PMI42028.1 cobalamin biosynthesis protein P47K [Vibrio lentus]PMI64656.1 cobalamin biosynthesis protein P47K [Vibrio lentus]PMJ57400.1 cobalamin biosynthesis protein P47K [Vibrio lentus]PMN04522.1 cobalamin biosynthesis protein P47K [Vibrio lentus]
MSSDKTPILGVPTNIITGFLGVGKTTAILNLMKNKPADESWAILVNEFGEIGVDGSLLKGNDSKKQVFIREVPGGCMCCTAGLPMQIALNQLLSEAKPDRLLIEPTGLGHPREVLEILSSEHYRKVLSLQKNITLVDARKLSDTRYSEHDTFNQQITIADTIVGNKVDLYKSGDAEQLAEYIAQVCHPDTKLVFAHQGKIPSDEFDGHTNFYLHQTHEHHHHHAHKQEKPLASELPMPETGMIKASNQGEGFESVGWRFSADKLFDRQQLLKVLVGLKAERMKAVFITQSGIFGYNLTEDGLTECELDECIETRIEVIGQSIDSDLENHLIQCLVS